MVSQAATIRIGILGAARIAPAALIAPARRLSGVEAAAIAARDPARALAFARRYSVPRVFSDYEGLIRDPSIDAVYIPLPNSLHFVWALRALSEGKHVLCEKPLTSNALEAQILSRAVQAPGSPVLLEALHSRFHPLNLRAMEIVQGGELGALEHVEAVFCTPMLRRKDIRFDSTLGGGAMMDLGCYMVGLCRAITGVEWEVERAEATLLAEEVDKRMKVWLTQADGASARIDVEMRAQRVPDIRMDFVGSKRSLHLVNPVLPGIWHSMFVREGQKSRRETFARVSSYDCQLGAFVDAIRNGGSISLGVEDSVQAMRVIDATYCAAGLRPRGYPLTAMAGPKLKLE
jgi:predicted dehydrogenase